MSWSPSLVYRIRVSRSAPKEERATFASLPPVSHGTQAMIELSTAPELGSESASGAATDRSG